MCAGLTCFRWLCCVLLVAVNILSILIGILLTVLGAILLWGYAVIQNASSTYLAAASQGFKQSFGMDIDFQSYFNSMANVTGSAAGVLIGFGLVLVIVSCIGCFGACCGHQVCLIIYMVCVGLMLIGQLIVVVIWFANSDVLKKSVRHTLDTQVDKYTGEKNSNFETITLNLIQSFVGCCGVVNGTDFDRSKSWNRTYTMKDSNNKTMTFELKYPVTCCKFNIDTFTMKDKYCPYNGTEATSNHKIGCYGTVFQLVESYAQLNNFFYALAGLLGLELLLIIGALLIYCAKRQEGKPQKEEQYKMQPVV